MHAIQAITYGEWFILTLGVVETTSQVGSLALAKQFENIPQRLSCDKLGAEKNEWARKEYRIITQKLR